MGQRREERGERREDTLLVIFCTMGQIRFTSTGVRMYLGSDPMGHFSFRKMYLGSDPWYIRHRVPAHQTSATRHQTSDIRHR